MERSFNNQLIVTSNALVLGKDAPGATEWFAGKLDDMRLYNRALTEDEIDLLYHFGEVETPLNVEIVIENQEVNLSWDEVSGAVYNVYSSATPYASDEDWNLEASDIILTSWSSPVTDVQKYFRVTTVK